MQTPDLPVSDALLATLLEAAGDVLRDMDAAEVPSGLRHLHGLDRRGLARGLAPRDLRRALDSDGRFAERVVEELLARDEVGAVLSSWSIETAVDDADDAAARGDLSLLVSALWAARPDGFVFGIGAAAAAASRMQREWGDDADSQVLAARVEEAEAGRRRAEASAVAAAADVERVETVLREERRSRREREEQAASDAEHVRMRIAEVESQLVAALKEARRSEARCQREAERADDLEGELAALRRSLGAAREEATSREEATAVQEQRGARPDESGVAAGGAVSDLPGVAPPLGVVADSADAVAAMVSGTGVVLVIDGYSLTQRAWADSPLSEQRSRLAMTLAQAHGRGWCDAIVVFDGGGARGVPPLCRPGLRVVFSEAGEDVGDVVVREVERLARSVSVLVASSDDRVRQQAESAGADVVSADALLLALGVGAAHL